MIHLHVHTKYSFGDALPSPEDYAKAIGEGGVLGITDHDNLSGMVAHTKACKKYGVKPIYGQEVTLKDGGHLTLLAKDQNGLINLFKLGATDRSWDDLAAHSHGLICLSGDISSPLHLGILRNDYVEVGKRIVEIFGRENFYLEEIDHGLREQKELNKRLRRLSKKGVAKIVKTNDVHYLKKEDYVAHAVLICDRLGKKIDPNGLRYHIPSEAWLKDLGSDPVAEEIAERCNVEISALPPNLPHFPIPYSFESESDYMRYLCQKGMYDRGVQGNKEYEKRLEYEIGIISSMGFSGYFLIVWDFIAWAKRQGIPVGPGRGSGAGSICAYLLNITDIDPIKYDLLFERFLNPERVSMPDFDIDFGQYRRGEVIKYVVDKYGEDSVSQIGTFSELKPRAAWKSAARVLRIWPEAADAFSRFLPGQSNQLTSENLKSIFNEDGTVKADAPIEYDKMKKYMRGKNYEPVIAQARAIEGAFRSAGKHAAGVLIADGNIYEQAPVWNTELDDCPAANDDNLTKYVCQLDKDDSEYAGLIKFDFLGLKELDVIVYANKLIRSQGLNPPDFSKMERDDKKTYELISSGRTLGLFQVASVGLSQFCMVLKPDKFGDLVALTSLYRPGPKDVGMHMTYVYRKNGVEPVEYLHPSLESVLGDTYGVIVYQEQVMKLVQEVAGYSLGQADMLRRAIGKKKLKEMKAQEEVFKRKGLERGFSAVTLEELWEQIKSFARYGFNRAHAASYSELTYITGYLKAHYTAELLAAQMQVRRDDFDEVSAFIRDAKEFGVRVIEPDVTKSQRKFVVRDGGTIITGLSSIREFSDDLAVKIPLNRPYSDLIDFLYKNKLTQRDLKGLICSGALDEVVPHDNPMVFRAALIEQLSTLTSVKKNPNQLSLFGASEMFDISYETDSPWTYREMLENEREYLGRYRSGHPIDEFRQGGITKIKDVMPEVNCTICGIIREIKEIKDKNDNLMCFLEVEDDSGTMSMTVFSRQYEESSIYETDDVMYFHISPSVYNERLGGSLNGMERAIRKSTIRTPYAARRVGGREI